MLPAKVRCATCGAVIFNVKEDAIFAVTESEASDEEVCISFALAFCIDCVNSCGGVSEAEVVMVDRSPYLARKGEKRE